MEVGGSQWQEEIEEVGRDSAGANGEHKQKMREGRAPE